MAECTIFLNAPRVSAQVAKFVRRDAVLEAGVALSNAKGVDVATRPVSDRAR